MSKSTKWKKKKMIRGDYAILKLLLLRDSSKNTLAKNLSSTAFWHIANPTKVLEIVGKWKSSFFNSFNIFQPNWLSHTSKVLPQQQNKGDWIHQTKLAWLIWCPSRSETSLEYRRFQTTLLYPLVAMKGIWGLSSLSLGPLIHLDTSPFILSRP